MAQDDVNKQHSEQEAAESAAPENKQAAANEASSAKQPEAASVQDEAAAAQDEAASAQPVEAAKPQSTAGQSISEGVAAARAEQARRVEMRSGVKKPQTQVSLKDVIGKQSLKDLVLRAVIIVVVLATIGYFLVTSLCGTLNVGITSSNADLKGRAVAVYIYEGDVSAALSDNDPSNDPEPNEKHNCTIGQRTTFNLHNMGAHTLWAELSDGNTSDAKASPYVVTAWGLDIGTQISFD